MFIEVAEGTRQREKANRNRESNPHPHGQRVGGEVMNCKPGDLAIRIQDESGDLVPVGAVVRCVRHYSGPANIDNVSQQFTGWFVEYQGHVTDEDGWTWAVPDEHLRPIREPGDDAQDETLSWLPVPSTKKEAA